MANGPEQYLWLAGGEAPVLAWQVKPDSWNAVADWCHGVKIASDPSYPGCQAVAIGSLDHIASLGWWVVKTELGAFSAWDPVDFTRTFIHPDTEN